MLELISRGMQVYSVLRLSVCLSGSRSVTFALLYIQVDILIYFLLNAPLRTFLSYQCAWHYGNIETRVVQGDVVPSAGCSQTFQDLTNEKGIMAHINSRVVLQH